MAVNNTQGIVLAIFGANAGGHLSALDANATANGNASLATDLSAAAGLILGVDLSSDAAFTSTVLGNLGIAEDSAGYTLASNYFTSNLAAGAGRGDLVAAAVDYLLGSSVDASLADTATAFSTRVTDGVAYSQGEGASVFGVNALQAAAGSAATAGAGESFTLTSEDDSLSGTAGSDTFTAALDTLTADDSITDASSTDNDTLNVADNDEVAMDVTGVENINIDWQGFATPEYNLTDVSGATVTVGGSQSGFLGNATFTNVDTNNITTDASITGTLTADGLDGSTVIAEAADYVSLGETTDGDGAITVTANAAETVIVDGAETLTVTALAADTITVSAGAAANMYDEATFNVGVDVDLRAEGQDDSTLNINSDADVTVTLDAASEFEVLNLGGSGAVDLDIAVALNQFTNDLVINNGGNVEFSGAVTAQDFSGVDADKITISGAGSATLNFANMATVQLDDGTLTATMVFQTTDDVDGSSDTLNLILEPEQSTRGLQFNGSAGSNDYETVNITVAPAATFDKTTDFDILNLIGDNTDSETTFNLISADSAVDIKLAEVDAATVDASGVAGEIAMTAIGNATASDIEVIAAQDETTADFLQTVVDSTFISGNSADDNISFDTTTGSAYAVFAGGDNVIDFGGVSTSAASLTVIGGDGEETVNVDGVSAGGEIAMILGGGDDVFSSTNLGSGIDFLGQGGDGDDTFDLNGLTTGDVVLSATAGTNSFEIAGTFGALEVTVTGGSGNDTLDIGAAIGSSTSVTADLGEGVNTVNLSAAADHKDASTLSISNFAILDVNAHATGTTFDESFLDGATFELRGDGTTTDQLNVLIDATKDGTYDFSGVTISDAVGQAIGGLNITTTASVDVVTATEGDDRIVASAGDDTLNGGRGDDEFVYDGIADIADDSGEVGDVIGGLGVADKIQLLFAGTALSASFTGYANTADFIQVLDSDVVSAGDTISTGAADSGTIRVFTETSLGSLTAVISSAFGTAGNAYFSDTAGVSAAIEDFQNYLTGLTIGTGSIVSGTDVIAFAKLNSGDDYYLAIAFVDVGKSAEGISAGDVDIRVLDMGEVDFAASNIEFVAS